MSILHRPGWANKEVINEGRKAASPIRAEVFSVLSKNPEFAGLNKAYITTLLLKDESFVNSLPSDEASREEAIKQKLTNFISGHSRYSSKVNIAPETNITPEIKEEPVEEFEGDVSSSDSENIEPKMGEESEDEEASAPLSSEYIENIDLPTVKAKYGDVTVEMQTQRGDQFTYFGRTSGDDKQNVTISFTKTGIKPPKLVKLKDIPDYMVDEFRSVKTIGGDIVAEYIKKAKEVEEDLAENVKLSPQAVNKLLKENYIKSKQHKFNVEERYRF